MVGFKIHKTEVPEPTFETNVGVGSILIKLQDSEVGVFSTQKCSKTFFGRCSI